MKTAKRCLAAMLGLVLAFSLAVPAMAQSTAPIITRQPKTRVYVAAGQEFTLNAQAKLPAGVEGTLSYACSYWDYGGSCDEMEDGLILCWDGWMTYTIEQPDGKFALRIYSPGTQTVDIKVYNDATGECVESRPVQVVVIDSYGLPQWQYWLLSIFPGIYYHIASLFNWLGEYE